jgi:hypothetical protein
MSTPDWSSRKTCCRSNGTTPLVIAHVMTFALVSSLTMKHVFVTGLQPGKRPSRRLRSMLERCQPVLQYWELEAAEARLADEWLPCPSDRGPAVY